MSPKHVVRSTFPALLLLLAIPGPGLAREDGVRGLEVGSSPDRKLSHPIEITEPGAYELRRDLFAADVAIIIRANQVTLDLGGHALRGPGGSGVAIRVENSSGVEVHNGSLGSFGLGVEVRKSRNVKLEHLRIVGEDRGGTPPNIEIGVMIVDSRGVVVAHNVIVDTFLGVFVRGGGSAGNRITENVVTGGQKGQLGICYNPADGEGPPGPRGDLVYDNLISRFHTGISLSAESVTNIVRNNDIAFLVIAISEASPGTNVVANNVTVQTF